MWLRSARRRRTRARLAAALADAHAVLGIQYRSLFSYFSTASSVEVSGKHDVKDHLVGNGVCL